MRARGGRQVSLRNPEVCGVAGPLEQPLPKRTWSHKACVHDLEPTISSSAPTGVPMSISPKTTTRKPPGTPSSPCEPREGQTLSGIGMDCRALSVMCWGRSFTKTMMATRTPARFSRTRGPPRTPLLKKKPSRDWKQTLLLTRSARPEWEAISGLSSGFSIWYDMATTGWWTTKERREAGYRL